MRPQFGIWDRQERKFDPVNVSRSGKQTVKPTRNFLEREHHGAERYGELTLTRRDDDTWRRYVIRRTGK